MIKKILIVAVFLVFPARSHALDRVALAGHIQEAYRLPGAVQITLGDPKPSEIPGFKKIDVTFSVGGRTQTDELFLSDNGRHYIMGGFHDLKIRPSQKRVDAMDISKSPYRGPRKAPVQVVEYTDFQCGFCLRGYRLMRDRIMKEYPKKVRWVYKSMPLVAIHPWARPAAMAAECAKAQSQEKFWTLHDTLFDRQREINIANFDEKLAVLAKAAKVNEKEFNACYDKQETAAVVDRDTSEAGSLGITGTPAFVVNGHLISGADYEGVKQAIDGALQGKYGKIKP